MSSKNLNRESILATRSEIDTHENGNAPMPNLELVSMLILWFSVHATTLLSSLISLSILPNVDSGLAELVKGDAL